MSLAQRADCVIEMVPQVGDFVAADQPLFRIFGDGALPPVTHPLVIALPQLDRFLQALEESLATVRP